MDGAWGQGARVVGLGLVRVGTGDGIGDGEDEGAPSGAAESRSGMDVAQASSAVRGGVVGSILELGRGEAEGGGSGSGMGAGL